MLVGRDREWEVIVRLLDRARAGRAGVVVVTGEVGIGKTALLDHAAAQAEGMHVVRAAGLESEARLEFSALFDVCRPLLGSIQELPERQAAALANALGIGSGPPDERFLIGAATLSLLAAAAEEAPLLVLVDDAQWIDAASADALLFAARRLVAEPVAVVVAGRFEGADAFGGGGFASIGLAGVDEQATAVLLAAHGAEGLASDVAEQVWRATGGNPLALVELPDVLTARQLEGLEPIEEPVRVGLRLRQAWAQRVLGLPDDAQQALLVAALSSSARLEPVVEALRLLELDERALETVEDAGLLTVDGGRVAFRHPLMRSAVVQGAAASARRRAHRALADALEDRSPDEQAWHLAAAALGTDERAAGALAEAAERIRARSGWASAALALERSARLTPDRMTGDLRLLDAAEAAWMGGRVELTLALTDELLGNEGTGRAAAVRLRSRVELHCGPVGPAFDRLLEAARMLEREDPAAAVALLADSVEAAELLGAPQRALEAADRILALGMGDGFTAEIALAQALRLAGRPAEARPHLERALTRLAARDDLRGSIRACGRGARAAGWLGRLSEGLELARHAVGLARDEHAFGPLAHALDVSAGLDTAAGRWREAYAHASEGLELARAGRCAWAQTGCLEHLARLEAMQGSEENCRKHAAEAVAVATGAGYHSERGDAALGLLELGLGRTEKALRSYEPIDTSARDPLIAGDLVEALIRSGRADEAAAARARMPAHEPDAVERRCAGLLASDDEFEEQFVGALGLQPDDDAFGRARTQLCFGERLRRTGRRIDARVQLRAAHRTFEALGARPWTERAAAELRATGERLGRREARKGDELTPQELQVAQHAAEGKTNKEIGAALFLSPKTVDFHLRRVFRKLDLRSRGELIRQFAGGSR